MLIGLRSPALLISLTFSVGGAAFFLIGCEYLLLSCENFLSLYVEDVSLTDLVLPEANL